MDPFLSVIIYAVLNLHAAQAWTEYPGPGILSSRPNASSLQTKKYCIYYYNPVTNLVTEEDKVVYHQVSDAMEWDICNESEEPPPTVDMKDKFVFLSDHNCSLTGQASRVQSYGGVGTLIVRERAKVIHVNETTKFNITLAFIHNSSYMDIMNGTGEVTVGIYSPVVVQITPGLGVIWIMAVFTVAVGSFWSGKVRHKLYMNERDRTVREPVEGTVNEARIPQEESSLSLSPLNIIGCMMLMCLLLLSLYYFYKYLVYVIMASFCIASTVAVFCCLLPLVSRIPCGTCRTPYFNIYIIRGTLELRQGLLLLFALGLVILWVVMRKAPWAWILQDALGIAFCINVLRMVRLPNLKICTILLCGLLVYDIFFVFITPLITPDSKSIMVEVARGGPTQEQLPIVLKVPNFSHLEISEVCQVFSDYNLLGFGDIMVPGLLIAFAFSFDLQVGTPHHLYYLVNIIGYGIGLLVTFVALWVLSGAQPALLYLVPFTLIPTTLTALIRGEFKAMWSADNEKFDGESDQGEDNGDAVTEDNLSQET